MKHYSWCPVCGTRLAPARDGHVPVTVHVCVKCGFEFWQNSKPAVGALIVRSFRGEPEVLLARRGIEPYRGMWDLPGGFLGNGERPEEGLARELREELGVEALRPRLVAAEIDEYPRDDMAEEARFVLCLYYRCEIPADAVLTPADDVTGFAWFPPGRLPDDIAFPANRRALALLQASLAADSPGAPGPRGPASG